MSAESEKEQSQVKLGAQGGGTRGSLCSSLSALGPLEAFKQQIDRFQFPSLKTILVAGVEDRLKGPNKETRQEGVKMEPKCW